MTDKVSIWRIFKESIKDTPTTLKQLKVAALGYFALDAFTKLANHFMTHNQEKYISFVVDMTAENPMKGVILSTAIAAILLFTGVFLFIFNFSIMINALRLKLNPDQGTLSIKKQLFATGIWRILGLILFVYLLLAIIAGLGIGALMLVTWGTVDWHTVNSQLFFELADHHLGSLLSCTVGTLILCITVLSGFSFSACLIATTNMDLFKSVKESWRLTGGRFFKMLGVNIIYFSLFGAMLLLVAVLRTYGKTLIVEHPLLSAVPIMVSCFVYVCLSAAMSLPYAHAYKLRLENRF
ncbi:MAG: hypothetical protein ACK5O7_03915 [Holosporales bacterium]